MIFVRILCFEVALASKVNMEASMDNMAASVDILGVQSKFKSKYLHKNHA